MQRVDQNNYIVMLIEQDECNDICNEFYDERDL